MIMRSIWPLNVAGFDKILGQLGVVSLKMVPLHRQRSFANLGHPLRAFENLQVCVYESVGPRRPQNKPCEF